jgi:DNA polymerase-3 subunit gamma/tau
LQEICDKEEIKAEKAALHVIAQKSEGCMRDALSILDKIVSFTNGKLNYSNTLEHLNILDEDYYFKMLDYMQQSQLSDAMLLYDEINRKGFEGDTLIEGYAEFVRNLLVSKDPKAAILLEVADDFKQKYLQASQKIETGWLIAALNLLNEAEINYKQARNKRLHVELTIIKLNYLLQAIELVNNDGAVSKKKVVEATKAIAFKALPIIRIKEEEKPVAAKLIIETEERLQTKDDKPHTTYNKPPLTENPKLKTEPSQPSASLGSLQKIREKIAKQNGHEVAAKPLEEEELYVCWGQFIDKLIERKNHSAVTNFKMASLKIVDANAIEITTGNNIQQKFIDQERSQLVDHLQQHFNNKLLTYTVVIVETEQNFEPTEKRLSSKEQYLKLIEEYPMIKELKDRLKLELDY